MLSDLLRALADPAPRSLPEIAASLGTTSDRLRIALEQCARMGYLEGGEDGCEPSACGGCAVECGMAPDPALAASNPRWWRLTERGRRAASMPRAAG